MDDVDLCSRCDERPSVKRGRYEHDWCDHCVDNYDPTDAELASLYDGPTARESYLEAYAQKRNPR